MSRLGFLMVNAWPDPDGVHVWMAHDCVNGRDISMLPNPPWSPNADGDGVTPSIDCTACGTHCLALFGEPEDPVHSDRDASA